MTLSCKEPAPAQQEASLSVYDSTGETPKSVSINAKGMLNYTLKVMAGADWTAAAKEGADWITITPTSGKKGMAQVKVNFAENKDLVSRSGRMEFACGNKTVMISVAQEAGKKEDPEIVVPPSSPTAPKADLLDVIFKNDGTAVDNSVAQMDVQYISGSAAVNYYHDVYQRFTAHFTHKLAGEMAGGYYKVDYTNNTNFRQALADGHTLETVFRMDQAPNGSEIKPFSSMQAGGTGFLIAASSRGNDITFLPNVSSDGKSTWRWAESGIVPEVGRYYHVVGVWDKQAGKASVYVDGSLKGTVDAPGSLNFPTAGNTWFCIGGDPSGSGAHAGFNGDVVLTRIYDKPLNASEVSELYKVVKNDAKSEIISVSGLSYLPDASVAKKCWY